jgi:mannan endo-1,6-alpha-mannosidase
MVTLLPLSGRKSRLTTTDSIKSTAKTLAGGIMSAYKSNVSASGIPGIFDDEYFFWESGIAHDGMIEYSYLTGDTQYDSLISEGMQ